MLPMLLFAAVLVLWATAAVLWVLDSPSPRATAAMVLDDMPVREPLHSVDLRTPVILRDAA